MYSHPAGRSFAANVSGLGLVFWDGTTGWQLAQVRQGMRTSVGAFHPDRDIF